MNARDRACRDEQLKTLYGETPQTRADQEITVACIENGGGMFVSNALMRTLAEAPETTGDILGPMIVRFCGNRSETPRDPFMRGMMEAAWQKAVEAAKRYVDQNTPEKKAARIERSQKANDAKYKKPTREECHDYAKQNGIPYDTAEFFWHMCENATPPWTDKDGKPIKSWRAKLLAAHHANMVKAGAIPSC